MNHKGTLTIETERLILRKTISSDAESMFNNWAGDPRVTKFLTWEHYKSVDEAVSYTNYLIEQQERRDFYDWKIVLKELGEPVGSISAVRIREDISEFEIGYCLGYNWWNKGIMTEAFGAVIKFLFEEVGANRVCAEHDPNNPGSGEVMKKCGLLYEGTNRQAGKNTQGICDIATYAILKEDYNTE